MTLNELLGLFTGLTVVYAFGFVLLRHGGGNGQRIDPKLFVLALMIAAIYCVAVWCAIAPKARWRFARRSAAHGRPWGWYLLSGLMAEAVALTTVMCVAAWLVHELLLGTHDAAFALRADNPDMPVQAVRPLRDIELMTMVIGFAIGSLVPSWYRTEPIEAPRPASLRQVPGLNAGHEQRTGG